MAWRGLHVSRRTYLSLADNQIVAKQEETEARVPIEDIAWIVLDSPQVTLAWFSPKAGINPDATKARATAERMIAYP